MNKSQALDLACTMFIPDFLFVDGYDAVVAERQQTEEAIKVLTEAYFTEENPDFDFQSVLTLADRGRILTDEINKTAPSRRNSSNLKRGLSLEDTIAGIAKLQKKKYEQVQKLVGTDPNNIGPAYLAKPIKGKVVGIDIETTGISPDRSYIVNVGWKLVDLAPGAEGYDPNSYFCGLDDKFKGKPVPLTEIHHITWDDIEGKKPLREDKELQAEILKVLCKYPYLAHNAAFEDAWFMYNIEGYAEARKAGKIIPIDTREICRKIDPEVPRLPRESSPASLESWAKRRHVLAPNEVEYHQGLEDVDLMIKTVIAEFTERNMF